jgi:hypothetical protein
LTPNLNKIVLGTLTASTSGTSIDFTSIPSGVRRITITFSGVSTNGTSNYLVQIGTSGGGIETASYSSGATTDTVNANATNGWLVAANTAAASTAHGSATLTLMDAATNLWAYSSVIGYSNAAGTSIGGGSKALAGTLDRVRLTTAGGANTFDAGSINIAYER